MSTKVVLFDLDGTLLPLDQNEFMKLYFGGLAKRLAPCGYEAKSLIDAIWTGTAAMVRNDGSRMNEVVFWETFKTIFGEHVEKDVPHFEAYYHEDFPQVKAACGYTPLAQETVEKVKRLGMRPVLATNPFFPRIATESRTRWAGLEPEDFELITTYENTGFCKPNPAYYQDLVARLGVKPEECLMVGNDVNEDMVAETLGMKVFLLTDCLLNKDGKDISAYPSGSFPELLKFLDTL